MFTVDTKSFVQSLKKVLGFVTTPDVQVRAADQSYTVEAQSGQDYISVSGRAVVQSEFDAVLDLPTLHRFTKEIKDRTLTVSLQEGQATVGQVQLPIRPSVDLMGLCEEDLRWLTIDSDYLKRHLAVCLQFADRDTESTFNMVALRHDGTTLHLYASDSYRMVHYRIPCTTNIPELAISRNGVQRLSRVLGPGPVQVGMASERLSLMVKQVGMVARVGVWEPVGIRYDRVIPCLSNQFFRVEKAPFLSLLKNSLATSGRDHKVNIDVAMDSIVVSSSSDTGSFSETLGASSNEDIQIAFNGRFLIEAISVVDLDWVTVQFKDRFSPILLEEKDRQVVVMPMKR